jgi:hypothetical protein
MQLGMDLLENIVLFEGKGLQKFFIFTGIRLPVEKN